MSSLKRIVTVSRDKNVKMQVNFADPGCYAFNLNDDPGENEKQGSLLIAKYGKGTFIYTGLSFFRQLPNGIPGAYKLFVNLISYNK